MSTPATDATEPGPVRKVVTALGKDLLTRANLKILLGALLVAVLGLFGGFDAAEEESNQVALAEAGTVEASPVRVEFHGMGEGESLLGESRPTVDMTVINTSPRPVTPLDLGTLFHWEELDESTYPLLARTGQASLGTLNPGVPVDVSLQVPEGAGVLLVRSMTWRESRLDGSDGFFDPVTVVEVEL